MSKCHRTGSAFCIVVLLGALTGGCSDKDGGEPKIRSRDGVAKTIDIENRVVSMTVLTKKGEPLEFIGTFTDKTEVIINGRQQGIRDVRPNDKVKVFYYKETVGDEERIVADKVIITRPKGSDWVSTTKPSGAGSKETPKPAGN